jgi:hypothetical protein
MKGRSCLVLGLFVVVVLVSAGVLPAGAQTPLTTTITTAVVSLASFDPPSPVLNPKYPVPLTLKNSVSGTPTHYRYSRFSDFRDAQWLPYEAAPAVQIPASWFSDLTPAAPPDKQVVLYFQVRAANPKAGMPTSMITDPVTGKTTTTTQPQFIQSNVKSKTVLIRFFG